MSASNVQHSQPTPESSAGWRPKVRRENRYTVSLESFHRTELIIRRLAGSCARHASGFFFGTPPCLRLTFRPCKRANFGLLPVLSPDPLFRQVWNGLVQVKPSSLSNGKRLSDGCYKIQKHSLWRVCSSPRLKRFLGYDFPGMGLTGGDVVSSYLLVPYTSHRTYHPSVGSRSHRQVAISYTECRSQVVC